VSIFVEFEGTQREKNFSWLCSGVRAQPQASICRLAAGVIPDPQKKAALQEHQP